MILHSVERVTKKISSPLRIALASDLHSKDPREALELLGRARPHLICVAGDMAHSPKDDLTNTLSFFEGCSSLAPVVYTAGNHEEKGIFLKKGELERLGVMRLENQCVKLGELWVGGFCDRLAQRESLGFARRFSQKEGFRLMLCHRPDYYLRYLRDLKLDLVLSGHAHGGQIRAGSKGVYAPGQGFFCSYVSGLYDGGRLGVSAGLANTVPVPRWGNPTEILLVHLKPSRF